MTIFPLRRSSIACSMVPNGHRIPVKGEQGKVKGNKEKHPSKELTRSPFPPSRFPFLASIRWSHILPDRIRLEMHAVARLELCKVVCCKVNGIREI